ncbi:serine/threonine protein kinase [Bordetella genomosp. 5]|nr:serine/threonine protein kinase [Bordetella genomosp. 5]
MPQQPETLDMNPATDAVTRALQWLEEIAEREGWSPKITFGLTLSVDEALTNILSYAFAQAKPEHVPAVRLSYSRDSVGIVIEIADNGVPYDPTTTAPPDLAASLDEADLGGHGVRLMRHYLDDLRYERRGPWNHLRLAVHSA